MQPTTDAPMQATNWALFASFAKLGLTSFGGGLTGWMMQECVRNRRWVTEDEFLTGLAMAQALPGVNVVNLPLWIGYRLGGLPGALSAAGGVVLPPMMLVMLLAAAYEHLSRYAPVNIAMQGAAAAAIGLSLAMGARAARRQFKLLERGAVLLAVFIAVAIVRLPLLEVVAVAAPISFALAYRRVRG